MINFIGPLWLDVIAILFVPGFLLFVAYTLIRDWLNERKQEAEDEERLEEAANHWLETGDYSKLADVLEEISKREVGS